MKFGNWKVWTAAIPLVVGVFYLPPEWLETVRGGLAELSVSGTRPGRGAPAGP